MIPIILKDYNWRQTADMIYVSLKIKGIKASKTSFVTADNYIRLHCQPYYFELFLWASVDESRAKCILNEKEELVVFELPKADHQQEEWPHLNLQQELSRAQKHEIRSKAVESSQKKAVDQIQAALARRQEQSQMTIREQLRLDSAARERIASIKSFHAETALNELNEWKKDPKEDVPTEDKDSDTNIDDSHRSNLITAPAASENTVSENDDDGASSSPDPVLRLPSGKMNEKVEDEDKVEEKKEETESDHNIWTAKELKTKVPVSSSKIKPTKEIPGIRASSTLTVSFTPREFTTPARESKAAEEEEWLKKQMEARRNCGFRDEDLRDEERNPTWLFEKGESLLRSGSYLGAVSAFSTGIKMCPKIPEFYGARAQAHLALSNVRKAVEDSSEGLELLTPKVPQNATDRARCHRVRGDAFYKLKMYKEAARDYKEVVQICPENSEDHKTLDTIIGILDKKMLAGNDSGDSSAED